MAIDTLKLSRRLREAGFTEPQAEAIAIAVQEGSERADVATQRDLADLGAQLRGEIEALGAQLRAKMREMEQRLIARMEGIKGEMLSRTEGIKGDILSRMMTMILTAVLVNVVTVLGAMFVAVRVVAH